MEEEVLVCPDNLDGEASDDRSEKSTKDVLGAQKGPRTSRFDQVSVSPRENRPKKRSKARVFRLKKERSSA